MARTKDNHYQHDREKIILPARQGLRLTGGRLMIIYIVSTTTNNEPEQDEDIQ
jgi:hypothetical protein